MNRQWVVHTEVLPVALQEVGLGAEPVFSQRDRAWYARHQGQVVRYGLGAPVDDAAQALLAYFSSNPCSPNEIAAVTNFQSEYNATGPVATLAMDGKYGQQTKAALQSTLDAAGAGVAPPACFDGSGNYIGPGGSAAGGGGGGVASGGSSSSTSTSTSEFFTTYPYAKPILLGAAAIATGLIGYRVLSKHKSARSRVHHHLAHRRHY